MTAFAAFLITMLAVPTAVVVAWKLGDVVEAHLQHMPWQRD